MHCTRIAIVALLVACAFAIPARAQEFSAIGVARDTTGHVVKSKVYMSGGKVRTDPQETGSANEQAYVILDLASPANRNRSQRGPKDLHPTNASAGASEPSVLRIRCFSLSSGGSHLQGRRLRDAQWPQRGEMGD